MENVIFFLCFSTLLVHEMDAVKQAEWRVLLGFLELSDAAKYVVFKAVHVPLYLIIFLVPN